MRIVSRIRAAAYQYSIMPFYRPAQTGVRAGSGRSNVRIQFEVALWGSRGQVVNSCLNTSRACLFSVRWTVRGGCLLWLIGGHDRRAPLVRGPVGDAGRAAGVSGATGRRERGTTAPTGVNSSKSSKPPSADGLARPRTQPGRGTSAERGVSSRVDAGFGRRLGRDDRVSSVRVYARSAQFLPYAGTVHQVVAEAAVGLGQWTTHLSAPLHTEHVLQVHEIPARVGGGFKYMRVACACGRSSSRRRSPPAGAPCTASPTWPPALVPRNALNIDGHGA